MIIILNGGSSAGKSSIAKSILRASNHPFLLYSIDTSIIEGIDGKFVPLSHREDLGDLEPWQRDWFVRRCALNAVGEQVIQIADGQLARARYLSIIRGIGELARDNDLVIDEVIWSHEIYRAYLDTLAPLGKKVVWVYIYCDPQEAMRRERQRQNRYIGLAAGLAEQVVTVPIVYDAKFDTTKDSSELIAREILRRYH